MPDKNDDGSGVCREINLSEPSSRGSFAIA